MPYFLAFWSRRSTATVVAAATSASARVRAKARHRSGYGALLSVQKAQAQDTRLIRQGVWVRRRRNGVWGSPLAVLLSIWIRRHSNRITSPCSFFQCRLVPWPKLTTFAAATSASIPDACSSAQFSGSRLPGGRICADQQCSP